MATQESAQSVPDGFHSKLRALNALLDGEPPYPAGTAVRAMQDERDRLQVWEDAHSDIAVAIAEKFLTQPRDMPWEDRSGELATAAIEAMQIFIALRKSA